MLAHPEPFPQQAPDLVPVYRTTQQLAGDHQTQARMSQTVGAGVDIEAGTALGTLETKNG